MGWQLNCRPNRRFEDFGLNTPLIWIVFPGLLAGLLSLAQRWERLVVVLGTITAAGLSLLAWQLPVQELFFVGRWTIRLADTWTVFGRQFILGETQRPALVVLYLAAAFWFGAAYVARPGRSFIPLALGIVALLTAAIAVEPFLYAALLIELAVLLSIPLLIPAAHTFKPGILRFLTYQTLGMPFILFSGWMLAGIEATPAEPELALRLSLLIGLGFAFLIGMIPFHTWIPMLSEESHPYAAGFIFLLLPGAILFFGLRFLDRYAWLRDSQSTYVWLRSAGVLMVLVAGLWAAFQRHLGRMLAYAVILEIGVSLVAVSLREQALVFGKESGAGLDITLGIFFASMLPRGLAFGVWALALTVIQRQTSSMVFRDVQGIARRLPLAAGSLVLAHFSLVGLPLLAGLPVRLALLDSLAQTSLGAALAVLSGMVGLLTGGLRTLAVLVMGPEEDWHSTETWGQRFYLALGILGLLAVGVFPQGFLPFFANLPRVFHLLP